MPNPVLLADMLRVRQFNARVLHGALIASIFINGYVAWSLVKQGRAVPHAAGPLPWILSGIALVWAAAILPLRRLLLPPQREGDPAAGAPSVSPDDPRVVQVLGRLLKAQIISWAMAEVVGIFGLVVGITALRFELAAALSALSVILLVYLRPRSEEQLAVLRPLEG